MVPARGWRIETDDLLTRCDDRTARNLHQPGQRDDRPVDRYRAAVRALADGPTMLLLDASHALGAVLVRADLADFTVSSCYKFALGIHEGVFAWNRARRPQFEPFGVGWAAASADGAPDRFRPKEGARRAEFGNAGHLGAYLLRESLDYLADTATRR